MNRHRHLEEVIKRESSKAGFRGKINAFCASCIYDSYSEGTWRKQVEDCTSTTCPLWKVRPTQLNSISSHNQANMTSKKTK